MERRLEGKETTFPLSSIPTQPRGRGKLSKHLVPGLLTDAWKTVGLARGPRSDEPGARRLHREGVRIEGQEDQLST